MFKIIPKSVLISIAKYVLQKLIDQIHVQVDGITKEDRQRYVDILNAKIGGNKKFEAATINLVIDATQKLLDIVKI